MSQDAWIASLSDGTSVVEHWHTNDLSPWSRLIRQCKEDNLYLTNLRLTICSKTISLKPHAIGYWQVHQSTCIAGVGEIPVVRGIGFVENNRVKIIWGTRTPGGHPYFWPEERPVDGQNCIIWKHKV
jgi:hypothetical protein